MLNIPKKELVNEPLEEAYATNLYLSTDEDKVKEALNMGIPAATLPPATKHEEHDELRVAFVKGQNDIELNGINITCIIK